MAKTPVLIKVCGMTAPANIAEVAVLSPSFMGFIFHEGSPRCALGVDPEAVKRLPEAGIRPVGVFVNKPVDYIDATCRAYGIRTVQLHGDETPADCLALKERGYAVLKAIAVTADVDWEAYRAYEDAVEMFVLDSKSAGRGGSGRKFDWAVLCGYPLSTPYLLGGGVSADDAPLLAGYSLPGMAGVDLNSRFEQSPGHKDVSLLAPFIVSLRKSYENE